VVKKMLFAATLPIVGLVAACSSSSNNNDAGASCSTSGGPVSGAADTHCAAVDGGAPIVQPVSASSCFVDAAAPTDAAADDGGTPDNPYGPTLIGAEGDDDDCKYHVKWTASPICTGADVTFTVSVTVKATGKPMTGAPVNPEVFLSETHPAPSSHPTSNETQTAGTYTVGPVRFDKSGNWTVRFHFNEQCSDLSPDSPHGHAAFFVSVP
jgi:hypothetical protein